MSGRNWTRKSIEELVEAYLRGKKRPVSAEKFIYLRDFRELECGTWGRGTYGQFDVGYLNDTPISVGSGLYCEKASNGVSDYIAMGYMHYQTRYGFWCDPRGKYKSGTAGALGSYNGFLVDPDKDQEVAFTILTVPKEFNIANMNADPIRIACDGFANGNVGNNQYLASGKFGIVTSDPINNPGMVRDTVKFRRTIYIPTTLTSRSFWSNNLITPSMKMKSNATVEGYYRCDLDETSEYRYDDGNNGFFYNPPTDATTNHSLSNGKFGYATCSTPVTSGELPAFITAVKNAYSGDITYSNSAVKDLNYMSIIFIDCPDEDFEPYMFALCRWFLDSFNAYYGFFDIKMYQKTGPIYDTDLPVGALSRVGIGGNSVVKYNKVII